MGGGVGAEFQRTDGATVQFRLMPVPVGVPRIHPGAMVGLRLICEPEGRPPLCVMRSVICLPTTLMNRFPS